MTKEQEEKFLFDTAIEQRTIQGLKGTLDGFIAGAQWQAKRMYTEEEVLEAIQDYSNNHRNWDWNEAKEWFAQFNKKDK